MRDVVPLLQTLPPMQAKDEGKSMTDDPDLIALRKIKLTHTLVWAFFATSIVAIPICSFLRNQRLAFACIAIVAVEVLILVVNRMSCPLTAIAMRYTDDRRANFDIYLPEWLARHNKAIFGSLYFIGIVTTLLRLPK
jgi:hypothetical protein